MFKKLIKGVLMVVNNPIEEFKKDSFKLGHNVISLNRIN